MCGRTRFRYIHILPGKSLIERGRGCENIFHGRKVCKMLVMGCIVDRQVKKMFSSNMGITSSGLYIGNYDLEIIPGHSSSTNFEMKLKK